MAETLEWDASLADAITPVLERIVEAVNGLSDQMVNLSEFIAESMQASVDDAAGSIDLNTEVLLSTTDALAANAAALEANGDNTRRTHAWKAQEIAGITFIWTRLWAINEPRKSTRSLTGACSGAQRTREGWEAPQE